MRGDDATDSLMPAMLAVPFLSKVAKSGVIGNFRGDRRRTPVDPQLPLQPVGPLNVAVRA